VSRNTVKIENPLPGGARYTNLHAAHRHVARGRAVWVGLRALRFLGGAGRQRAEAVTQAQIDRTAQGYDRVNRVMSIEELAGIPVVCPRRLLGASR
jgi:hypothetical protein